jgi:hypothetical protein
MVIAAHQNQGREARSRVLSLIQSVQKYGAMHGATPTGRHGLSYSYYMSIRKINGVRYIFRTEVIERQVPEILHGIHIHPDALPRIRSLYQEQIASLEGPIIAERIERLHVEEAALVRLYTQGKVTDRNYDSLYKEWQSKLIEIKQEIRRLEESTEQVTADLDRALALPGVYPSALREAARQASVAAVANYFPAYYHRYAGQDC